MPSVEAKWHHVAKVRAKAGIGEKLGTHHIGVVRDSFSMPAADYALIATLKQRCLQLGLAMKKSEILRAGLAALDQLSDDSLRRIAMAVESVKTGRPPGKEKRKKRKTRDMRRAKRGKR